MTDTEIRIAIAEACGWTSKECGWYETGEGEIHWLMAKSPSGDWGFIPDYLNNLTAMQCAVLSQPIQIVRRFQTGMSYRSSRTGKLFCELLASDWAEEFLKTLNLWRDD